jgi:hypothetical protein
MLEDCNIKVIIDKIQIDIVLAINVGYLLAKRTYIMNININVINIMNPIASKLGEYFYLK